MCRWLLTFPILFMIAVSGRSFACGNSANFFGCSSDIYYEIPSYSHQIAQAMGCNYPRGEAYDPNIDCKTLVKAIQAPLPSQVKLPDYVQKQIPGSLIDPKHPYYNGSCFDEMSHKQLECIIDRLFAEQFSTYMDRYPIRHLFDNNAKTYWVEGYSGSGTGRSFLLLSNAGPIKVKGIKVVNGCAKSDSTFQRNNRVKEIRIIDIANPAIVELSKQQEGKLTVNEWELFNDQLPSRAPQTRVQLLDSMQEQTYYFPPMKMQEILIQIDDVYKGSSKEDDTCLSELHFILTDGSIWPEKQNYWLETIPGYMYQKSGVMISTDIRNYATKDTRIVTDEDKVLIKHLYPGTTPDADDPRYVEPTANLFSKQGLFVGGILFSDLKKLPINEHVINRELLSKDSDMLYSGYYPIKFVNSDEMLCLYDMDSGSLMYLSIPSVEIYKKEKLPLDIKNRANSAKLFWGEPDSRPSLVLQSVCEKNAPITYYP